MNKHTKDEEKHKTPLWVKVFGIIGIILVLIIVIMHLTGKASMGHTMTGIEYGVRQP